MRVLIAVPTFENIYPDTFKAIYDMDKGGHDCEFEFVRGYDVATARNRAVQLALDGGYDYLMFVDNDVTPPRDALVNLISHGVDVCSGYYAHRDKSGNDTDKSNVCKLGEFNYTNQYTGAELKEMRERGDHLFRIHGGGMGCILIRVDVFRRIKYPWYDWVNYVDDKHSMLSEDLYFCEECKFMHIKIHADSRVACGHMMRNIKTIGI